MKNTSASDFRKNIGEMLETVIKEPVVIQKNGRAVAVVLSIEEYERFQSLEDAYWGERVEKIKEKASLLNHAESMQALKSLISEDTESNESPQS